MPGEASLTLDRRLLPGTDADEAVEQIRGALGQIPSFDIAVKKGVHHLPWKVPRDLALVRTLAAAHEAVRGRAPEVGYVRYAFDAGYANFRGIPTVMFGPASPAVVRTAARDVLATEFIPVSAARDFAKIYAHAMLSVLGAP
jgi:acetylornithine deacetylase/succinyl-diaminopimelate desuccinylase-like protein